MGNFDADRTVFSGMCPRCGRRMETPPGESAPYLCPVCAQEEVLQTQMSPATGPVNVAPPSSAGLTSGYAVAALTLGICSIATCCCYGVPAIICGILAVVFARKAVQEVELGQRSPQSLSLAKAGRICGWVGLGLGILYILFFIVYIIVIIIATVAGSH